MIAGRRPLRSYFRAACGPAIMTPYANTLWRDTEFFVQNFELQEFSNPSHFTGTRIYSLSRVHCQNFPRKATFCRQTMPQLVHRSTHESMESINPSQVTVDTVPGDRPCNHRVQLSVPAQLKARLTPVSRKNGDCPRTGSRRVALSPGDGHDSPPDSSGYRPPSKCVPVRRQPGSLLVQSRRDRCLNSDSEFPLVERNDREAGPVARRALHETLLGLIESAKGALGSSGWGMSVCPWPVRSATAGSQSWASTWIRPKSSARAGRPISSTSPRDDPPDARAAV